MRAVFGLLLIMLGLAMAVVWMPQSDRQGQLVAVTDIATQGISRRAELDGRFTSTTGARTFSPQTPLLVATEPSGGQSAQHAAAAHVLAAPGAGGVASSHHWSASIVTPALPGPSLVVTPTLQPALPSGQRSDISREEVVRGVQRELRRVGCYGGEIDGDWGNGSRRALTTFMERVNASLPVDEPDSAALALLQAQAGVVCGRTCPGGQSLDGQRCVPNAVLARRRPPDAPSQQVAATAVAPVESGWTMRVTRSERAAFGQGPSIDVGAATSAAGQALPGRMSVGAVAPEMGASTAAGDSASSAARQAARGAFEGELQGARPLRRERARSRRGSVYAGPAPRFYGRPVVAYRSSPRIVSAQSFYGGSGRRPGRAWTATFFGAN